MRALTAAAMLLPVFGCQREERPLPEPSTASSASAGQIARAPPAASAAPPASPPFVGTIGVTARPVPTGPVRLEDVRTGRHDGYDRVVFQLEGNVLPGYHIEYIDKPVRRCGSGEVTAIAGDGWLEVRLSPANAHDGDGRPTVGERKRRLGLGVLREIELTCDFEAMVTWVLGVASPNRYRVLELQDPARLVVDIRH